MELENGIERDPRVTSPVVVPLETRARLPRLRSRGPRLLHDDLRDGVRADAAGKKSRNFDERTDENGKTGA